MNRQRNHQAGFTLLELVIVMGIIAFLSVGTITAFVSMSKGSRIEQAQDRVDSLMRNARAYAISKQRNVLIVFATSVSDERNFRSACVYDAQIQNGGRQGDFVGRWVSLPTGVYFDKADLGNLTTMPRGLSLNDPNYPELGANAALWMKSNGTLGESVRITLLEALPKPIAGSPHDYDPIPGGGGRSKTLTFNWQNGGIE